MQSSSLIQRQLRINAQVIQGLSEELANLKNTRRAWYDANEPEQAKLYTPYILKFEKKLKKMQELQSALKGQLKQRYATERIMNRFANSVRAEDAANGEKTGWADESVENVYE
jgi:hypothetical protein